MILVAELNHSGKIHTVVNSSLIKIIATAFPHEPISIYGEAEHVGYLAEAIPLGDRLSFFPIRIFGATKFGLPFKLILDIFNIIKVVRAARKYQPLFLFVTSVYPISHYLLKAISSLFATRIMLVLHGELEFMRANKKSKYVRILGWFLKKALRKGSGNITYLVLGDVIKNNLMNFLKVSDPIVSIDHPYAYTYNAEQSRTGGPLSLGCVGVGSIDKRMDKLFALASSFQEEVLADKIHFHSIGPMLPNMAKYLNGYVHYNRENTLLDRTTYEHQVLCLDYIMFFYDNEYYKMCSSGAFFDAINFEKPIVALKNDFFQYYFNKLGDIGFLFDNVEEMENLIREILAGKLENRYLYQKFNIKIAKQKLSLAQLSVDFASELKRVEFC